MDQALAYPRYDTYKGSGVDWIGEIPNHWEAERAKWLFKKKERPVRPEDDIVTAFRDGVVTLRSNRRTEGFTNALQEHGYQGIRKGDLVIHAMDAFAGAIGVSDSDGKSTPVYAACVNRGEYYTNNHYYAYLLRYMSKAGYIEALAKGIRERSTDFRFNDFAKLTLPVPPRDEQDRIANFLDQRTAEIDEAIAKKQRLIELLKEQKAILVNQAVTKGLDPDASMRDSGVEWIGEMPEHWTLVSKMKFVSSMKGRQGWQGLKASEYGDEGPHVLSSAHFDGGAIFWEKCPRVSMKRYLMDESIQLKVGDVLLMKDGANMGKLAYVDALPGPACLNSHLLLFRSLSDSSGSYYLPKYMYFHMMCDLFQDYVKVNGTGATFLGISQESVGNYPICLPPIDEQEKIVAFVEDGFAQLDQAIAIQHRQKTVLEEYKVTITAEAVTGKIKL